MGLWASATLTNSTLGSMTLYGGAPTVTGNTFTDSVPIRIADPDADWSGFAGNTYSDGDARVSVGGTLTGAGRLGSIDGVLNRYEQADDITVSAGATLTLEPGIRLETPNGSHEFHVWGRAEGSDVEFVRYTQFFVQLGGEVLLSGDTTFSVGSEHTYVYGGGRAELTGVEFLGNATPSWHYESGSTGVVDNVGGVWDLVIESDQVGW